MAIEPIQQFQSPTNSLLQVLQGGNQAITGILDRAIQIGRDMSDKRTRQEQDMAGMRLAETNLAQRRGEELSQNIEDAQRFAQNAYQFEKNYAANREDRAAMEQRQSAQDVLQQSNADRNYGLAARNVAVSEGSAQRQADVAAAERARLEAERASAQNVLTPGAPAVAAGAGPAVGPPPFTGPPAPTTVGMPGAGTVVTPGMSTDERLHAEGKTNRDVVAPSVETVLTPPGAIPTAAAAPVDRQTLVTRLGELDSLNPRTLSPEQRKAASVEKAQIEDRLRQQGGTGSPFSARDQQLREESAARSKAAAETRAAGAKATAFGESFEQGVKGNLEIFPNPYSFAPKNEKEADMAKRESLQKTWGTDKASNERQAALRMGKAEYVNSVTQYIKDPVKKAQAEKVRGEAWEAAKAEKEARGVILGAPTSTGAVSQFYKPTGIR